MSALKFAKEIVREVQNYQKIKAKFLRLHTLIKRYEHLKSVTREHKKKATISAHIAKLHNKAELLKKQITNCQHRIHQLVHQMYKAL